MYLYTLRLLKPALKENKKLTALVIAGTLIMVGLSVCFNKWREAFYNAIQAYDATKIYYGLGVFTALALVFVFVYGISSFYQRYLEFALRQYLFNKFSAIAQEKHDQGIVALEQRCQDDSLRLSQNALSLLKAVLDSSVRLPVFLFLLYSTAKLWMVGAVIIWAAIGTLGSRKVASKLITAEYFQESLEAKLRRELIQSLQSKLPLPTLKDIIANWQELALRQKYLSYYTSFYGQISVIFPFVMLMPLFLNHTIMLGALFATSSAIEQVLQSLSVFVESRDLVVNINMCGKRLKELE